jgi:hypothetical protein
MSNWRNLQAATGPEKKVQLKQDIRLEVRYVKNEAGKIPVMVSSSKNEQDEWVETIVPEVKGFYIGQFQLLEAWDETSGLKYQSSPYFKTDNMVWLNDRNKSFSGMMTVDEAKNALLRKGLNPSVKTVVVLATQKGTVTIKTNSSLWINQFKLFQYNDIANDYVLNFVATSFHPENPLFKSVDRAYSNRLNASNYPACLIITQGEAISDRLATLFLLEDVFKNYLEYRDSINTQMRIPHSIQASVQPSVSPQTIPVSAFPSASDGDDLPF